MNNNLEVHQYTSEDKFVRKFSFTCKHPMATFETSSFFIPDRNRHDLCVSTMAGCPMGCKICSTTFSSMPFERALTADEMCMQVKLAVQERNEVMPDTVLRIGFMGNGEPFGNFKNMMIAIKKMVLEDRLPIGEIAISTLGVNIYHVKELAEVMHEVGIGIKLQLSLYSIDTEIRQALLPLAPTLESILDQLDWYASVSGIPVRYNYPLISGINDTTQQLDRLMDFLLDEPELRRLKLSAFNTFPGVSFQACPDDTLLKTVEWFENQGVKVDLFLGNRDHVIFASCGQMRSNVLKPYIQGS